MRRGGRLIYYLVTLISLFLGGCGSNKYDFTSSKRMHKVNGIDTGVIRIPPSLQKGDTVAIIAPAGYVDNKNHYIERADSLLYAWGLVPVHGKNLFARHFQFAGTDEQRASDLQWAINQPQIKAIWAARGGYGSVRILDQIQWDTLVKHPKWLIGFSDITVLSIKAYSLGIASIHGIMPISLAHPNPERKPAIVTLKNLIFGRKLKFAIPSDSLNIRGTSEGRIIGGNLSLLVSLLGSDLQLDTTNKILFLEDVSEYPYSYDRMLYALARAGYFDHLAGLIIGDMSIKKDNDPFGESVEEMILKHIKNKSYPVIFHFPAGHVVKNYAIPMGKSVRITVKKKKTVIEFR